MGSDFRAKVDGKLYSAPEISSMILRKLKKDAEDYIGETVTDAVITVPAYFRMRRGRQLRMQEGLLGLMCFES